MTKQETIENLMTKLNISEEEAEDTYEYDKKVDRNAKDLEYELPSEKAKVSAEARRAAGAIDKTVKKTSPKPKNLTKEAIVSEIFTSLGENMLKTTSKKEILNKNRLISFELEGKTYELTLVEKRIKQK